VRVYGKMFDEKKLSKIREGMTINGIQYGPYIVRILFQDNYDSVRSDKTRI
jgi:hypothetical protein